MKQNRVKTYSAIFAGTPEFAVPVLNVLHGMPEIQLQAVITQPDKPVGRKQTVTASPIKQQANVYALPVLQPGSLRSTKIFDAILKYKPDIGIVVAYGKIIPPEVLKIPTYGWVNIHASLLPAYRGASPMQAAIVHGDTETGVTLMQLDAGLDTGPIIAQLKTPISSQTTISELHDTLSTRGATLLQQSLIPYLQGDLPAQAQPSSNTSMTRPIQTSDGSIDWQTSATHIERQIRAYTPWPGVYTFWKAIRLIIKKAHIADNFEETIAGRVKRKGKQLIVGTGNGALVIDEIQREGKKSQSAEAFLAGAANIDGAQLG
ncbi:MAG: methionyl-tRNA formyltransferase [Candidatus Kerfeldbacteria bacterium]|nr:methionyl-tRNA formyltransferase [Candidatus Kerfeldbacteria bacterium]